MDRLRFIGIGGAFYPEMGSNAAFFTVGDDIYLLDCGETAFFAMKRTRLFDRYPGQITVAVTHLHADHAGSLATLALYAALVLRRPLAIVHPHEGIQTLLGLMGVHGGQYRLLDSFDEAGVVIAPRPARHAPGMPAFSYEITVAGESFYYSGDTGELPEDVLQGVTEGRIARAYQDVAQVDAVPENPVHLPLSTLARLVPEPLRERFTLMHLNCDYRAEAEKLGFPCARIDSIFTENF